MNYKVPELFFVHN